MWIFNILLIRIYKCSILSKILVSFTYYIIVYMMPPVLLASVTLGFCLPDNRLEELQEKYSQEVEERKRLETELKILQVKVRTFSVSYYSAMSSPRLLKLYALCFSS